ncbi:MAG TPA: hypothetical protein VGM79_09485 [Streptosporangiaceae bacterium]|jgi:hypothetical protein
MTDVLIRDVPDDVIAAVDAHAGRGEAFGDLADPDVMSPAWE